jgi:hypothetical protein
MKPKKMMQYFILLNTLSPKLSFRLESVYRRT